MNTMSDENKIVIMSDGTGKTAKRLMDAVLAQYSKNGVEYSIADIYQQVRDKKTIDAILSVIEDEYLVIFSIISEDLAHYLHKQLSERSILHLNVLEPMLGTMSKFLGVHPNYEPGILQIIDERYYRKIDAIGYTVEHDDGRGSFINEADLVLVGLSRTCKTPISMYLACNFGMKVANIPVVADEGMTRHLLDQIAPVKKSKVFGLMMMPEVLLHVREERLTYLAHSTQSQAELSGYFDLREIRSEHRYCRQLFASQEWDTIDVTRRAIEEISMEILDRLGHKP